MIKMNAEGKIFEFANLKEEHIMEKVNHPNHYKKNKIEVIDIIEDFDLNFSRGNVIKYLLRAGEKCESGLSRKEKELEDLRKSLWYLTREIERLVDSK